MSRLFSTSALFLALSCFAQKSTSVVAILPDQVRWKFMKNGQAPGVVGDGELASLAGNPESKTPAMYVSRGKFHKGTRLMPHWHPDTRYVTVISGTYYQGVGDVFDSKAVRAYPPGSFLIVPAGLRHFVWAKDGEVVIQESGISPTSMTLVNGPEKH